jgi:hypothetical protein
MSTTPRVDVEAPADAALAADQRRALELIATGASLTEVLDYIVIAIESRAPGMRGSVLVLPDGLHLRHGSS